MLLSRPTLAARPPVTTAARRARPALVGVRRPVHAPRRQVAASEGDKAPAPTPPLPPRPDEQKTKEAMLKSEWAGSIPRQQMGGEGRER